MLEIKIPSFSVQGMHSPIELGNSHCGFEDFDIYYCAKTAFHWIFFFFLVVATLVGFSGIEFSLRPSQLHRKMIL